MQWLDEVSIVFGRQLLTLGCSVQQSWISLGDFAAGVSDAFDDSISVSCYSGFGVVLLMW